MIYPGNFEKKIGFDDVRQMLDQYCLCGLGRKKVEETIHIKLDIEDINLKLGKTATYQEIQEYILKLFF